jgi:Rieske Fe-S protein
MALFPLRLFLGGTFVYAGIQKLSDPGFLNPDAPTYIGTQLEGFADGTPGGFLLDPALTYPVAAGVGVALLEIAIGVLVLMGFLTRPAALAGLGLNLVLFLTASWHTTPYFLGADIVFVCAWLPFVLAGAEGQPTIRDLLEDRTVGVSELRPDALGADDARRYTDSASAEPAIVIRSPDGALFALSAVCTHAGCQLEYTRQALTCPCHSSTFDIRTGAPERGPARRPLATAAVSERGGRIVVGALRGTKPTG